MTVDVSEYVEKGTITYYLKDNTLDGYATKQGWSYLDKNPILFKLVDDQWQLVEKPERVYADGIEETGPLFGSFENFQDGTFGYKVNVEKMFGEQTGGIYMLLFEGYIRPIGDDFEQDDYFTEWTSITANAIFELPERE